VDTNVSEAVKVIKAWLNLNRSVVEATEATEAMEAIKGRVLVADPGACQDEGVPHDAEVAGATARLHGVVYPRWTVELVRTKTSPQCPAQTYFTSS
jgi:hypothetical protein